MTWRVVLPNNSLASDKIMSDEEWAALPPEQQKQYRVVQEGFSSQGAALQWTRDLSQGARVEALVDLPGHTPGEEGSRCDRRHLTGGN
jgi:hypothetical protein